MTWQAKLGIVGLCVSGWLLLQPGSDDRRHPDIDRLAARQLTHPEAHEQLLQAEEARRSRDGPLPLFCAAVGLTALVFGPDLMRRFRPDQSPLEEN